MKNEQLLKVSSSPHVHSGNNIPNAMRDVIIALLPATIVSIYFFGLYALAIIVTSIATAMLAEYVCQRIRKVEISLTDYSAAVTGLLFALVIPPATPLWLTFIGATICIVIGKQVFGGLGNNLFNPALVGRAILVASWPVFMTSFTSPFDGLTSATPLNIIGSINKQAVSGIAIDPDLFHSLPHISQLFLGNISGSMGETSALALLIGGLYLIYKKHIDWKIPSIYVGTVFLLALLIPGPFSDIRIWYAFYNVFAGGLLIGAFFMATDWVTSPTTKRGRIIYAVCLGLLTFIIRKGSGMPEGVAYSILIMNMVTPLIDRYTRGRVFGEVKKRG